MMIDQQEEQVGPEPESVKVKDHHSLYILSFQQVASSSVVDLSSSRPAVTRMSRQRLSIPNEPIDSSTIRPDLLDCILKLRPRVNSPMLSYRKERINCSSPTGRSVDRGLGQLPNQLPPAPVLLINLYTPLG